ncbi:MAG: hypothetical protein HZA50_01355 [Planctomycetes bacterium]|nr:hypothetical protein [Planctomycetota bacterium]
MLEWWNNLCLTIFDFLLGFLLRLPSDLALLALALISAAILVTVRRFTTNQDLLHRAAQDKKRLKELTRQAKQNKDKEARRRYKATKNLIAARMLSAEGLPLLATILPIAMLATWAIFRLEFHPLKPGQDIQVSVYTPVSARDQEIHIVPMGGLAADGWVKVVEPVKDDIQPHGKATWILRGQASEKPYILVFRLKGRTFQRELIVDGRTYAPQVVDEGDRIVTEVQMNQIKLFGMVPGIDAIAMPPWIVAYLILAIMIVPLLKRAFRIW